MRIAYLSADYGVPVLGGKGGSVHIQQTISGLVEAGHEVVLYCSRLGDGDPNRIPARIIEVAKAPPRASGELNAPESERARKERGWMARAHQLEAQALADHAEHPFDMIYERYSLWSRAGVQMARTAGIPALVEVNAPLLEEAASYRELALADEARAIEAEVFSTAQAIVAVSEGVRRYVVGQGARADRVHVIPNGVDPLLFRPDAEPADMPQFDGCPVIGFVGGLKPWHGLRELLTAFEQIAADHPDARLLIAGDGPMRGWIEGFLDGTRLADRAHVTGWCQHDALPSLVARMDIATAPYPSLDSFYFSPLKLLEYMSAGRAVVASRIGQIAEIVSHGDDGLLIEPGNAADLAESLSRLLVDPALRQRLGANARATSGHYTWAGTARRIETIARTLIAAPSPRSVLKVHP